MIAVVGNGRFFLLIAGMLFLLVMGSQVAGTRGLPAGGGRLADRQLRLGFRRARHDRSPDEAAPGSCSPCRWARAATWSSCC